MSTRRSEHRSASRALDEQLNRRLTELLRRQLAGQRAAQRAPAHRPPPAPTADDRALYDEATPRELARAEVLLKSVGFVEEDLSRGRAALRVASPQTVVADERVDEVTRARARALRRARR